MNYRHAEGEPFTLHDATAYDLYRLANGGDPDAQLFRALADAMPKDNPAATLGASLDVATALRVYRAVIGAGSADDVGVYVQNRPKNAKFRPVRRLGVRT